MQAPPHLVVVGSVNLDLTARCRTLPQPGETLHATGFSRSPGGKGANQALAARRLGAEVSLIGSVGRDDASSEALRLLRAEGVDLGMVKSSDAPTGTALITVADDGENTIVIVPGANGELQPGDVDVSRADGVLCQLEVPVEAVEEAAAQASGLFVLNAAPCVPVPSSVVERADVIVVNEIEHRMLRSDAIDDDTVVVVTKGREGAVALQAGSPVAAAEPPAVRAVDTVGAGDAFVAALVVALLEGTELERALEAGCAAGALATTVSGAQAALPHRAQIR